MGSEALAAERALRQVTAPRIMFGLTAGLRGSDTVLTSDESTLTSEEADEAAVPRGTSRKGRPSLIVALAAALSRPEIAGHQTGSKSDRPMTSKKYCGDTSSVVQLAWFS